MQEAALSAPTVFEKWFELCNDRVLNVLKASGQNCVNGFSDYRQTFILENYKSGSLGAHAHVTLRFAGDLSQRYCLYWLIKDHMFDRKRTEDVAAIPIHNELHVPIIAGGEVHGAMLVSVRQSIQDAQGIASSFGLPSIVRLQLFDDCLRFWGNPAHVVGGMILPFPLLGVDRKLPTRTSALRLDGPDESAHQVIKCGADVEYAVSSNGAESQRGPGVVDLKNKPCLGSLWIDFRPKLTLLGIDKNGSLFLEDPEVLFSPVYLGIDAHHSR